MGFTKLDDRLLMSSLLREPAETFKIFIVILSACGPDGIARVSAPGLAGACFMSIDRVRAAIKTLEAPDPDSRTTTDEGRRLRKVDGGFLVVNYAKYRELSYSNKPDAVRKRRSRMKAREGKVEEKTEEKNKPLREDRAEAERHKMSQNVRTMSHNGKVSFDGSRWIGLTAGVLESLRERFPICDVNAELEKMAAWITDDPARIDRIGDWTEFIESWLKRPKWTR